MDTELRSAADVSGALIEVLARQLHAIPSDVDWNTVALPDLGLDSMSAIELVIDIEDRFGAQFPEERLVRETFATFPALVAVVRGMVEQW
ncbi:MAG: acyl carrier protein [Jatrophihabitantaceae bacterium]